MEVKQVKNLVNTATNEALGREVVVAEDLSNVVDLGDEVFNANAVDKYVKALVNHIGRMIFVDRPYRGSAPSVLMDGWEFGSVLEKVQADLPLATENETWELENGTSYDPNIFYAPKVSAKFFNKRVTFEVPMSFTELQVKQSFSSAQQMNGFMSMLYNAVEKAMTVKIDALTMRTINNMTGETIYSEYPTGDYGESSGVRAVNLLYLYNERFPEANLTAEQALTTPEFIRFASLTMKNYIKRLTKMSTLFNVGGKERFTPSDLLHVILLSDFESSAEVYLYDGQGQFNVDNVRLPRAETVPYWQGSGDSYAFEDTSAINITTSDAHVVNISGILGVMFDRDALGVTNLDRRVTSNYNPKAEFYTNWYKFDAGYFNDLNENFVVFFVSDSEEEGSVE
jgi:hypothetical protein